MRDRSGLGIALVAVGFFFIRRLDRHRRRPSEGLIPPLGQPLQPSSVCEHHPTQTDLHLSLGDHLRQAGDDQSPPGNAEVRMRADGCDFVGNYPALAHHRQLDLHVGGLGVLLVQDGVEGAVGDRLVVDRALQCVEMLLCGLPAVRVLLFRDVLIFRERPDLDREHLERIEHRHCHRVGALVRQVAPDAGADHLVGLPDVDRLAVVIEEGVFIALTTPTPPPRATPAKSSKSPKTTL